LLSCFPSPLGQPPSVATTLLAHEVYVLFALICAEGEISSFNLSQVSFGSHMPQNL
jgi:hypothetical protein